MFIYDKPIETEKEDFLGRKRFSNHLGKALLDWKEKESLIIAIYGEWGSGKSSIINLATENIEKSDHENKPTIIEFNPWVFSEESSLSEHFFTEIARELEIRNDTEEDKKIAGQLKHYANILSLVPDKDVLSGLSSKVLMFLGLIGISSSQIISWLNIPYGWIQNALFIGGLLFFLVEIFKSYLKNIASYFEKNAEYKTRSESKLKKEIKKELIKREKKLVIVVDDIDRLNQSEIRQIFKLIRVNADFPNTIYLLAFDRNIIEKNLEEQVGISGKDYLDKIVQVSFDVPFARPSKVSIFLFKELDRILGVLPESAHKYFEQNDPYWANVYHSGFKNFFKNIRDVKRFASSLDFNISQMYQGGVMEVNPIDFIAIEAIRVFAPDFYLFMRDRNALFTSTDTAGRGSGEKNVRKDEIESALNILPPETNKSVLELIRRLFPQINGVFQYGYSTYSSDWQTNWSSNLKVCATNNYDSYFTLIPGGDEEEISQFEIEEIMSRSDSEEKFEMILRKYIENKKIRKVLGRLQNFTDDQNRISQRNAANVVRALFNISDDIPEETVGMWDLGIDMDIMRIMYQLLKRETDKNKNYELLKEAITSSKGLYGPVQRISFESSRREEGKIPDNLLVPEDNIQELQRICIEKIKGTSTNDLLTKKNLTYILYRWKEWDTDKDWERFIAEITADDKKLVLFVSKFISETKSQTIGDYGVKIIKKFNYKSLGDFIDLKRVQSRIKEIKKKDFQLYKDNKDAMDLFLDHAASKDSD